MNKCSEQESNLHGEFPSRSLVNQGFVNPLIFNVHFSVFSRFCGACWYNKATIGDLDTDFR